MSVADTHREYDRYARTWQKMHDVSGGQERVQQAGEAYLPRLTGQSYEEYDAYLRRSLFLNATGRTIDGLSGLIFRKPPQMDHPSSMDGFMDDVDLQGSPFQAFAENVIEDVLTYGRAGLLTDFPQTDGAQRTRAEADAMGQRPYWTQYAPQNILDWQTTQMGHRTVLGQVRLWEEVSQPVDEFSTEDVEQIRVLELVEGTYQQRLFRKINKDEWRDVTQEVTGQPAIVPNVRGRPLNVIPFVFLGPRDLLPHVSKPPLLDLANVNLTHYQVYADYRHFLYKLAPTPYLFGVNEDEVPTGVGPDVIWISQNPEAKAGILQADSSGLGDYKQALDDLKADMAVLGARMLAPEKRQVEAAETAAIHRMGENATLSSISQAVSLGLTRALEWAAEWMGANGTQVGVTLNRDFLPVPMDAREIEALLKTWQAGGMSKRTLFDNLQRGEVIDSERTFEDEEADIQDEQPAMPEPANAAE
jgi:hypothetical protein